MHPHSIIPIHQPLSFAGWRPTRCPAPAATCCSSSHTTQSWSQALHRQTCTPIRASLWIYKCLRAEPRRQRTPLMLPTNTTKLLYILEYKEELLEPSHSHQGVRSNECSI